MNRAKPQTNNPRKPHPRTRWDEAKTKFLINNLDGMSPSEISRLIGVSTPTIYKKMRRLGLKYLGRQSHWSSEEREYLVASWGKRPIPEIEEHLSPRPPESIRYQAYKLGLGRGRFGYVTESYLLRKLGFSRCTFQTMACLEKLPCKTFNRGKNRKTSVRHKYYNEQQALNAAKQFLRRETLKQAAQRYNLRSYVLDTLVAEMQLNKPRGKSTRRVHRFLPEQWDSYFVKWARLNQWHCVPAAERSRLQKLLEAVRPATSTAHAKKSTPTGNVASSS